MEQACRARQPEGRGAADKLLRDVAVLLDTAANGYCSLATRVGGDAWTFVNPASAATVTLRSAVPAGTHDLEIMVAACHQDADHWGSPGVVPSNCVRVYGVSLPPGSTLAAGSPGNALKDVVADAPHELLVTKQVNSAFHGEPDLDAWLRGRGIRQLVLCGIQTNMCVETSARLAGNLGYDVVLPIDATHTFDLETILEEKK